MISIDVKQPMKEIRMLHDKIALVTGATFGIGKAIAIGLAQQGATVVLVGRDRRKGEAVKAEIAAVTGNTALDLLLGDLSSQQAIRHAAHPTALDWHHQTVPADLRAARADRRVSRKLTRARRRNRAVLCQGQAEAFRADFV